MDTMASINRRAFFGRAASGIGAMALGALLNQSTHAAPLVSAPHFAPRARRIIYLFQSGGPSQMDLFDYKPGLRDRRGEDVPTSVYPSERKTTMSSGQTQFPVAPSKYAFRQHGSAGIWMSELLPNTARIADDLCVVKSMYTDAINHDPAITFLQTGSQVPGRPSMGAWMAYGLGSETEDLPAFVAMNSRGKDKGDQPLYDRLWGSGFLPSHYQGVKFRNQGDLVLDISNPDGIDDDIRRTMLDTVSTMNARKLREYGDPEIHARIAQYEMAYRMQASVPELADIGSEPESTFELYGQDARISGTYAYNCLIARRLAERGVRFVQLFHQGWDQHGSLPKRLPEQCLDTDRASAALVIDLKQRGMLDDTLVIWGGEFGRTVYCQGELTHETYGRDHHPSCFTMWMAGGGIRPGLSYGETDDYSVNVVEKPVHVHDLHATILHLMGIDHERLTYSYQGRDFRLTDVHGRVVHDLIV
ncbi:MAG: hypothetical protein AMXMBFR84_41550 [Candidatus Hydrogenedentota bacterium]